MQQGNRSSSSACGSADVLDELGVVIDLEPEVRKICEFVSVTATNSAIVVSLVFLAGVGFISIFVCSG